MKGEGLIREELDWVNKTIENYTQQLTTVMDTHDRCDIQSNLDLMYERKDALEWVLL